ncbi:MAG: ATP-binding cassette domain-containing protein, partial [Arcanobacterium sp.]|nr:ATP-binding cassette domain-containing protein [Arcanobacterium sp.]
MEAVISASAVSKYYGAKKALDDFSLEIFPGEVFGVIGPNGAGKTTFMRMLVDFIRPDSGDLKIWGLSPQEGGAKLRRNIGYLPGEVKISPQQTGRELIKFWVS